MSATPEETSPVHTVSSETYQQIDRTSSETPALEIMTEKSSTRQSSVDTDQQSSRHSSSSMTATETPSPEADSVNRKLKRKLEKLESGEEKPTDKKVKTWEERLETDALYYFRVEDRGVSRHDPVSPWGTHADIQSRDIADFMNDTSIPFDLALERVRNCPSYADHQLYLWREENSESVTPGSSKERQRRARSRSES